MSTARFATAAIAAASIQPNTFDRGSACTSNAAIATHASTGVRTSPDTRGGALDAGGPLPSKSGRKASAHASFGQRRDRRSPTRSVPGDGCRQKMGGSASHSDPPATQPTHFWAWHVCEPGGENRRAARGTSSTVRVSTWVCRIAVTSVSERATGVPADLWLPIPTGGSSCNCLTDKVLRSILHAWPRPIEGWPAPVVRQSGNWVPESRGGSGD